MPSLLEMNTFIVGFIKGIAYDVKQFCKDHFFSSSLTSQVTFKIMCS